MLCAQNSCRLKEIREGDGGRAVKTTFPWEPSTHVLTPQGYYAQAKPPHKGRRIGGFWQTGARIPLAVVWSKDQDAILHYCHASSFQTEASEQGQVSFSGEYIMPNGNS